jgi:Asp-tRNA(Asn)/Glu-tRNA(Gln) amidotransferase A subunit family amidase
MDTSIHAWVQVLPQKATCNGRLSGIPFGAKDVFETKGLATEYGSPVYKGRVGAYDAAIVRDLRDRGAILLGKTQTAAFAMRDPPPTRNPRNVEHTPGGSSSGSAAAVAVGMVPFAIGTQTSGSTIKPASYCGITGFKVTYGLVPLDGCLQYAKSLDTLGLFTQTPADMRLLWEAMGHPTGRDEDFAFGVPEPMLGSGSGNGLRRSECGGFAAEGRCDLQARQYFSDTRGTRHRATDCGILRGRTIP